LNAETDVKARNSSVGLPSKWAVHWKNCLPSAAAATSPSPSRAVKTNAPSPQPSPINSSSQVLTHIARTYYLGGRSALLPPFSEMDTASGESPYFVHNLVKSAMRVTWAWRGSGQRGRWVGVGWGKAGGGLGEGCAGEWIGGQAERE
jgi:hypothetical protein